MVYETNELTVGSQEPRSDFVSLDLIEFGLPKLLGFCQSARRGVAEVRGLTLRE